MSMTMPIEISAFSNVTCSKGPQPVMNRQTGQQKADRNGEPLYVVELVCFGDGTDDGAQVVPVRFPGTPPAGLKAGVAVKVTGLVVSDWEMADKHGLIFRAAKVEPVAGAAAGAGHKGGAA